MNSKEPIDLIQIIRYIVPRPPILLEGFFCYLVNAVFYPWNCLLLYFLTSIRWLRHSSMLALIKDVMSDWLMAICLDDLTGLPPDTLLDFLFELQ